MLVSNTSLECNAKLSEIESYLIAICYNTMIKPRTSIMASASSASSTESGRQRGSSVSVQSRDSRSESLYGRDSVVDEGNPLAGVDRDSRDRRSSVSVENLHNTRAINPTELKAFIMTITATEDFNLRMQIIEKEKLPYTFTSTQLVTILNDVTSVRTRIFLVETLGPRLMDPRSRTTEIIGMFRFNEEREKVEAVLKARASYLSATVFRSNSVGTGFSRDRRSTRSFSGQMGAGLPVLTGRDSGGTLRRHASTNNALTTGSDDSTTTNNTASNTQKQSPLHTQSLDDSSTVTQAQYQRPPASIDDLIDFTQFELVTVQEEDPNDPSLLPTPVSSPMVGGTKSKSQRLSLVRKTYAPALTATDAPSTISTTNRSGRNQTASTIDTVQISPTSEKGNVGDEGLNSSPLDSSSTRGTISSANASKKSPSQPHSLSPAPSPRLDPSPRDVPRVTTTVTVPVASSSTESQSATQAQVRAKTSPITSPRNGVTASSANTAGEPPPASSGPNSDASSHSLKAPLLSANHESANKVATANDCGGNGNTNNRNVEVEKDELSKGNNPNSGSVNRVGFCDCCVLS